MSERIGGTGRIGLEEPVVEGDANPWLRLRLVDATKDDAPSAEDSGTTDLVLRIIGANTNPSQAAASRNALLYRWGLDIPAGARGIELQLPTVGFSLRTNTHGLRFALLDSTPQGTSVGFVFDLSTTATANRMGVTTAWSAIAAAGPVVTPTAYRGGCRFYVEAGQEKLGVASLIDLDSGGESGRVSFDTSLVSLAGLASDTLYLAIIVHTPTGTATVFTLSDDVMYRWVTDPS